jgi:1-acyl-sn-glycerol-3-phosphate acyltransferase
VACRSIVAADTTPCGRWSTSSPEGTRGRAEYWKSGFYHIAQGAGVPIVLGLLDYKKKVGGLFEAVYPSGNIKVDMDKMRAFYRDASGKYPDSFGPVRLQEEATAAVE